MNYYKLFSIIRKYLYSATFGRKALARARASAGGRRFRVGGRIDRQTLQVSDTCDVENPMKNIVFCIIMLKTLLKIRFFAS